MSIFYPALEKAYDVILTVAESATDAGGVHQPHHSCDHEGGPMKILLHAVVLAIAALSPMPAHAQVYEFIKWCKGNWRTIVVCVVVEKGVERVVEKSIDEWWTQWSKGEGKTAPPARPAPPSNDQIDFRTLMKNYEPLKSRLGQNDSLLAGSVSCVVATTAASCATLPRCRWAQE